MHVQKMNCSFYRLHQYFVHQCFQHLEHQVLKTISVKITQHICFNTWRTKSWEQVTSYFQRLGKPDPEASSCNHRWLKQQVVSQQSLNVQYFENKVLKQQAVHVTSQSSWSCSQHTSSENTSQHGSCWCHYLSFRKHEARPAQWTASTAKVLISTMRCHPCSLLWNTL